MGKRTRTANRLSAIKVAKVNEQGLYPDGLGLYLQVSANGAKSWIYRYSAPWTKGNRDMGLGPFREVALQQAREMALNARRLKSRGIDPIDERLERRRQLEIERASAITFKEAAERYIARSRPDWRNIKHAAQWTSTLTQYA